MRTGCCGEHKKDCHCAENAALESKLSEGESTRRDVQTAIELQERNDYPSENSLICGLSYKFGWNSNHAREIATAAWTELYAEKEGE